MEDPGSIFGNLTGIALVTGAAGGIGEDVAFSFARAGVKGVIFADIDGEGALQSAIASEYHALNPEYQSMAIQVDVGDEKSVEAMVEAAVHKFGRIHYAVHCAGMSSVPAGSTTDLNSDLFRRTMDINVNGTMYCVRAFSRAMAKQSEIVYDGPTGARSLGRGCIVNIASTCAFTAPPGMMADTASKHAVVGITKTAAVDNFDNHIRVNAVCPSWVDTAAYHTADYDTAAMERTPSFGSSSRAQRFSPLSRPAARDEISGTVLFLCSPTASYINGAEIVIDSGASLSTRAF